MTDHHMKARNGATRNTTTTYEFNFPQPKEKIPFKHFIYNPKDGSFLGRTGSSWAKILIFYVIFYAGLSALFAICLQGLFSTLTDNEPKYKLDRSLIGSNPGMGYRPLSEETERGSVIKLTIGNETDSTYWINSLEEFLKPYQNRSMLPGGGTNQEVCNFTKPRSPNKVCEVDVENFGECAPSKFYGYKNAKPCVFLKLNKIFGWVPQYYHPSDLPEKMPQDLKDHIAKLSTAEQDQIWISCKGQHSVDTELIKQINFYPSRGFQSYYYPYTNTPGYLSPLVAVQITPNKLDQLISIECRAWAKNIKYSGSLRDRMGSVTFQISIDSPDKNGTTSATA